LDFTSLNNFLLLFFIFKTIFHRDELLVNVGFDIAIVLEEFGTNISLIGCLLHLMIINNFLNLFFKLEIGFVECDLNPLL